MKAEGERMMPREGGHSGIEGIQDRIIALVSATNEEVQESLADFEENEKTDTVGYVVLQAIADGRISTFEDAMAVMHDAFPDRGYADRSKAANAIRMATHRGGVSVDRLRFNADRDFVVAGEICGFDYRGKGMDNFNAELVSLFVHTGRLDLLTSDLVLLQRIVYQEYGIWEADTGLDHEELIEFVDRVNTKIAEVSGFPCAPKIVLKNGVIAFERTLPNLDPELMAARIKGLTERAAGLKDVYAEMTGSVE